ncbi:MAG: hypothetical protein R3F42_15485 [Pseudomonadota bacterium]
MVDIILFWAGRARASCGLDTLSPSSWKKIGTTCQNRREAHLILQLLKDCCR